MQSESPWENEGNMLSDMSFEGLMKANQFFMEEQWISRGQNSGCEIYNEPESLRVCMRVPFSTLNCVVRIQFKPEDADRKIDETHAYFESRNVPMIWEIGPTSRPYDIRKRLLKHGATFVEDQPAMSIDLEKLSHTYPLPDGLTIKHVDNERDLQLWGNAVHIGSDMPKPILKVFVNMYKSIGYGREKGWRHYLALLNSKPVGTASLFLGHGVAGINTVGTVPDARNRGIGTAVTLTALHDARKRGYRIGALSASKIGHSMYKRMRFSDCGEYGIYVWDKYSCRDIS